MNRQTITLHGSSSSGIRPRDIMTDEFEAFRKKFLKAKYLQKCAKEEPDDKWHNNERRALDSITYGDIEYDLTSESTHDEEMKIREGTQPSEDKHCEVFDADIEEITQDSFPYNLGPTVTVNEDIHQIIARGEFERHMYCYVGLYGEYVGRFKCDEPAQHARPFMALLFRLACRIVKGQRIVWSDWLSAICKAAQDNYVVFQDQTKQTFLQIEGSSWDAFRYSNVEYRSKATDTEIAKEDVCEQALRAALACHEKVFDRCLNVFFYDEYDTTKDKITVEKRKFWSKLYKLL